jgi:hypothetical protein
MNPDPPPPWTSIFYWPLDPPIALYYLRRPCVPTSWERWSACKLIEQKSCKKFARGCAAGPCLNNMRKAVKLQNTRPRRYTDKKRKKFFLITLQGIYCRKTFHLTVHIFGIHFIYIFNTIIINCSSSMTTAILPLHSFSSSSVVIRSPAQHMKTEITAEIHMGAFVKS